MCSGGQRSVPPLLLVANHGVEYAQQVTHAGGHGHLAGFAVGLEARIERLEGRVVSDPGEDSLIERRPHDCTATGDMALPMVLATVVGDGRDAGQRTDGAPRAELGRASCRERVCQYGWISVGA